MPSEGEELAKAKPEELEEHPKAKPEELEESEVHFLGGSLTGRATGGQGDPSGVPDGSKYERERSSMLTMSPKEPGPTNIARLGSCIVRAIR